LRCRRDVRRRRRPVRRPSHIGEGDRGYESSATREYRRLLDDKTIDGIVAAVPDHWHRRMVVEAVSAGKDIYIEKPMSHTAAEASRWWTP